MRKLLARLVKPHRGADTARKSVPAHEIALQHAQSELARLKSSENSSSETLNSATLETKKPNVGKESRKPRQKEDGSLQFEGHSSDVERTALDLKGRKKRSAESVPQKPHRGKATKTETFL